MIRIKCLCLSAVLGTLASVIAFASPASAAPIGPPEQLTCWAFNDGSGEREVCGHEFVLEGTGQDLHLVLANQCSGSWDCYANVTLLGTFDRVVIERANECANQATCTITVDIQAEIKKLRIQDKSISAFDTKFRNRCDPTAICVKTP